MNDRIVRALRRQPVDATPVWFMRQAGRSLPRYREVRSERGMFEVIQDPPAAAGVTELPLEYYPVDAAILYNDLSTPFLAAGLEVKLEAGVGPVVSPRIEKPADIDLLRPYDPREAMSYTMEQIRILVDRLDVALLAFVGAPFTLSSYLIGGPGAKNLDHTKAFMWREPEAWSRLSEYWADHQAAYAIAQHEAGAAAIQIFDSWAGVLSVEDYDRYVLPWSHRLLEKCREAGVPTIHFVTGNPSLLPLVADAGGDCIAVDWRLPIDVAWDLVGDDRALQGNLDPATLMAGREVAVAKAREVLERVAGRPGHIFNTGHGLMPDADPDVVHAVVDVVHEYGTRS